MNTRTTALGFGILSLLLVTACGDDKRAPGPAATGGSGNGGSGNGGSGNGGSAGDAGSSTGAQGGGAGSTSGGAGGATGGAGGATGGSGGSNVRVCTLSTNDTGCDECIRTSVNASCLACEDNPDCVLILSCIKQSCLTPKGLDLKCSRTCIESNPDGQDAFNAVLDGVQGFCPGFCLFQST